MAERRGADGINLLARERLVDGGPNRLDELVRVGRAVLPARDVADGLGVLAAHGGADRGRPDVESQHPRHCGTILNG